VTLALELEVAPQRGPGAAAGPPKRAAEPPGWRRETPVDICDHYWSDVVMKQVQIADLKAHLSQYLAQVRRGDTVVVCDRNTPIARLVPYTEADDVLVVHEPTASPEALKRVAGVRLKRAADLVRMLRDSRDQR
jgi:prevent-host-death family protein